MKILDGSLAFVFPKRRRPSPSSFPVSHFTF